MNPSSAQSVISGIHGRERRQERNIPKDEGKLARRLGMKESAGNGLFKYTYKGYVFILSPAANKEVTSYLSNDWASPFAGTRRTEPLFVPMKKIASTSSSKSRISQQLLTKYSAHTIFLVDMSSAMRQDDMDGARCRADGIFYSLATGFVNHLLMHNNQQDQIVSVILLHELQAKIHVSMKLVGDLLFNMMIDLREWTTCRPNGDCDVALGLQSAIELMSQSSSDCRLNLCLIASDSTAPIGDPSSSLAEQKSLRMMKKVARHYSSRLAVRCIGLGYESDSFSSLKGLVAEAKRQGVVSTFGRCGLDVHLLSELLSGLDDAAAADHIAQVASTATTKTIFKVYMWNLNTNDFGPLVDRRCQACYALVGDKDLKADPDRGWKCASCNACFFCVACMGQFTWHLGSRQCTDIMARPKSLVHAAIPSYSVSIQTDAEVHSVAFTGRELRFINTDDNQPFGAQFVCKELGSTAFENVDIALKRECRRLLRNRAIVTDLARKFIAELDNCDAQQINPRLRISQAFIMEIEGGHCCLVNEKWTTDAADPAEIARTVVNVSDFLDAFSHFTYERSAKALLGIAVNDNIQWRRTCRGIELFVTNVILHSSPIRMGDGDRLGEDVDLRHHLLSHRCNSLCRALKLPCNRI